MSIQHHPSEAVLTAYASGGLADGPTLAAAAHLEACPACRAAAAAMEAVGGALLEEEAGVALGPQALDLALARIERPLASPRHASAPQDRRAFGGALPRALRGRRIGPRRFVAPGLWVAHVRSQAPDGWRTYLLHAGKGQRLLEHGHKGVELTVVLSGAFRDATGIYGPGDFGETGEGMEHQPEVEGDEGCLCLIAAQGGVKAQGLARLLQPFLQV